MRLPLGPDWAITNYSNYRASTLNIKPAPRLNDSSTPPIQKLLIQLLNFFKKADTAGKFSHENNCKNIFKIINE